MKVVKHSIYEENTFQLSDFAKAATQQALTSHLVKTAYNLYNIGKSGLLGPDQDPEDFPPHLGPLIQDSIIRDLIRTDDSSLGHSLISQVREEGILEKTIDSLLGKTERFADRLQNLKSQL